MQYNFSRTSCYHTKIYVVRCLSTETLMQPNSANREGLGYWYQGKNTVSSTTQSHTQLHLAITTDSERIDYRFSFLIVGDVSFARVYVLEVRTGPSARTDHHSPDACSCMSLARGSMYGCVTVCVCVLCAKP